MASCSSSSSSSSPFSLKLNFPSTTTRKIHSPNFKLFSSNQIIQLQIQHKKKAQRKPRPSFSDQVLEKWSKKPTILQDKFPWQRQDIQTQQQKEPKNRIKLQEGNGILNESRIGSDSFEDESVSFDYVKKVKIAPWVQKTKPQIKSFDFDDRNWQKDSDGVSELSISSDSLGDDSVSFDATKSVKFAPWVRKTEPQIKSFDFDDGNLQKYSDSSIGSNSSVSDGVYVKKRNNERDFVIDDENDGAEGEMRERVPWEREKDLFQRSSNTPLAEKMIPEFELKRLRNKAARMVERFRVGAAGVTQELVDAIHGKWEKDEVVKLKFKGPSTLNMKRIHESLESRTGGIVIWRSGSSAVLFRGMAYKLPCVQSFTENKSVHTENESSTNYAGRYVKDLTEEELLDLKELNLVLDGLGPRFKDWSGREPLPVDADLLPSTVQGYKRPFRLLPYGTKPGLLDKEMTFFRRTARTMPPHFALGRNRDLQGLAVAMTKLWERSAIAKIAIKRGVHNTCNDRMAEELKRLTGGTLVSRNKDYIVFYRGNDFLPSNVTRTLNEAQDLSINRQDDEDKAREKASTFIDLTTKNTIKGPLVAGTLSETMAATSRWGIEPSSEEIEKMRRDSAVARHASLVKILEKKLAVAKGKIKKAEKALAKVQEYLRPSQLPTDLETLTDEERFSLRKLGLSMKPYLELGRRGIFDGTIENMHLHWKYRELVKIMVERKSFAHVKHVAISLEAESGGVLVSVDKTTKGYAIIVYRGKNYERPKAIRPKNLLTRRKALARAIELQRREALRHHMSELSERIEILKQELEDMKTIDEIDEETLRSRMGDDTDSESDSDDRYEMAEDEEAYLETYQDDDQNDATPR
uniref:CRM-domain containing factor CFM3, chloroplastic/mitochondrial n=1 Tax=Erigeron canadensis TaxID=72917 RepID=UPI001CB8B300|nr:CRM-domain containing factor CFM3, chloroplastic/mitochondrial [Erigeron canadensis]